MAALDIHQAIARAQAEYVRCIDDGDLAQWPDFFTAECTYKVTTADNHRRGMPGAMIYAASRGMLADRVASLRDANIYERHAYRHLLGQPYVVSADGGEARSETSFVVARVMRDGSTDLFATGRYCDIYAVTDSGVKLRERIVVCDSSRIDTLLALPL
ncbi:aromatic-ring-hydroxylating dioxygenase subunit beta [Burkholderia gladioli]|uniref:Terephthalate 1,2-dioxygenase oxygenase component beta chain n=1 Tax=Burkholderia gladioli TaxID=28095 RepID=A0AAW3F2Z9_BURGA|nr:aromatic-ring-hydroxylating dioxygenase subunit beta [Burkholderia gladioli]AJW94520.1 terephthalate 1,2-dioxygenase oxygenase component beta chain [Burkholderia gladioli]ASD83288.1 terephthalate 1,2-dioxygenase [Burkholderia gladioli pv. gladioli]AWY50716.1 terephthalate 1,2-dioxygenase [Burkholderia gladioli pv. gladioli]KGC14612.1 terephthalate 1,2-dioxygenase oxygenase component beta chain [Burkholderia gladioli]MDJ1167163.1 aromatic-ring-hydroxylating dioxygenase subunit beta [Burkhold